MSTEIDPGSLRGNSTLLFDRRGDSLRGFYQRVRRFTERLVKPLSKEDCVVQSMHNVSPMRWHLAHTTWFFETMILRHRAGYRPFRPEYASLFNSYYQTVGDAFPKDRRGILSRPGLDETLEYRAYVDAAVDEAFGRDGWTTSEQAILLLGLHHERQHQELVVADIKHIFSCNPLRPSYQQGSPESCSPVRGLNWLEGSEGVREIGRDRDDPTFAYDNEFARHKTYVQSHRIADRCVTNGEYRDFINDGGYRRPELWLSLGWERVTQEGWRAPLYWEEHDGRWFEFTLGGLREVEESLPVCHVSYFEADAYARWQGRRLPTEAEWEVTASRLPVEGVFVDRLLENDRIIHPCAFAADREGAGHADPHGFFGGVWEWTGSAYLPYPGYRPPSGSIGEYNGKFMCNQFVLRGGSCATHSDHIRPTYRNFFPPEARWQFSGIRLAE